MNLGNVYLQAFFYITATSFVIAAACTFSLRLFRRIHAGWLSALAFFLGVFLAITGNRLFHRDLFVTWHRSQNAIVPQTGCLTYEPSFGYLYATYAMDRFEFERWVSSHPWTLLPYDSSPHQSLQSHDAKRLGFDDPEIAYATEMADDGGQLRVYFQSGTMFLSYNVM